MLLLDLKLQDLDAVQIIRQLSEAGRLPPFLIITGQGDEKVAVEMMKSGARDYLVKSAEFLEALPSVVARELAQLEQETKLAAAEEALLLSEHRFRVALKNSAIMVFNQDADLRYTWVHNGMIPGMVGKADAELYPADEADRMMQIKTRVLLTGEGVRQEITRTVNNEKLFYDLTVEPILGPGGRITGITGGRHGRDRAQAAGGTNPAHWGNGTAPHRPGFARRHLPASGRHRVEEPVLVRDPREKDPHPRRPAAQIAAHVRDVIAETRSLARGLSPFILEAEGFVSALRELAVHTGSCAVSNVILRRMAGG